MWAGNQSLYNSEKMFCCVGVSKSSYASFWFDPFRTSCHTQCTKWDPNCNSFNDSNIFLSSWKYLGWPILWLDQHYTGDLAFMKMPCPPLKQLLPPAWQHLSLIGHKCTLHHSIWPVYSVQLSEWFLHDPPLYPIICSNQFHKNSSFWVSVSKENIKKILSHDAHPKSMNWPGGTYS